MKQERFQKIQPVLGRAKPALPFLGLTLLMVVYLFVVGFRPTSMHLQTIINQVAVMAVLSTGAVFIFSLGSFDISLGVGMGVSVAVGVISYNAGAGVWGMFAVCLLIGLGISLVNSTLSSIFQLPVFIMTMAMMSVLTAVLQILMGGKTSLLVPSEIQAPIKAFDSLWIRLAFVGVYYLLCVVLFNYTKIGRRNKFQGGNPVAAAQTGISVAKQTMITFLISGSGVGLSAFLTLTRAQSVSSGTGASMGMDVMMAIVFGGMPLSGGAYSKIAAGIIGSFSMVLLSQILTMLGVSAGTSQMYKAVLFLAVVFAASFNYREKMLSRAEMF
ncbi:MAG: ABC transporter permease [Clostridium sp.]|nr:ABC transporter permease [Clostridium sp.]